MLTGFEFEILNLDDERYINYEAKESVLNVEITG